MLPSYALYCGFVYIVNCLMVLFSLLFFRLDSFPQPNPPSLFFFVRHRPRARGSVVFLFLHS